MLPFLPVRFQPFAALCPQPSGGSVVLDASGPMTAFNTTNPANYTGLTSSISANLIICIVSCLANSPPSSVVWDPSGANQTFTQLATQSVVAGGALLRMYGLISPGSFGNKTIAASVSTSFAYGISAVSFIGANSTLANAVPSANIIQGGSNTNVASWNISSTSDSITVASGHQCVIANMCGNGSSSSATWTTNSGSTSFSRTAYYVSSGTATLTITPDVSEQCAGIAIDVSP